MHTFHGGAVASESPEAAQAAIDIMNKGGNAVDAAVAAVAVQGVTRPFSGGIGGGGFINIYLAEENRHLILDHHTLTSAAFGPEAYVYPKTGEIYPMDVRISSGMATAVPGAPKGWEEAVEKYGNLTLAEVLQPAIEVAENGFTATPNLIREISENATRFRLFPETAKLYLDEDGNVPKVGTLIRNPDMAKTYRLVAEHGSKVFYEGEIAEAIIKTVTQPPVSENPDFAAIDEDWKEEYGVVAGNMTLEDLKNYETLTYKPLKTTYRGYDLYQTRSVSSGGITIGLALNILEQYDLKNMPRTKAMHYYIEAMRHAFADRTAYVGDPKHVPTPEKGLGDKAYATERRQLIKDNIASTAPVAPGDPWPFDEAIKAEENEQQATYKIAGTETPEKENKRPEQCTIHLTVSDKDGNVVSFTNTILFIGGNGMVVPGYGFLLNDMLLRVIPMNPPTHPDYPRPNMRPLSNMSPTIVLKDGKPVIALGSPGAETIVSTVLQTIVNYIDFDMSFPDAIATPRLTELNHEDGHTRYESLFEGQYQNPDGSDLIEELRKMGHQLLADPKKQGTGSVTAIEFFPDGKVLAVGEPIRRGGGTALVQHPTKESTQSHLAE